MNCVHKVHYSSKRRAKRAARRSLSHLNVHMVPYSCDECDGWHLTSHTAVGYRVTIRRAQRQ